MWFVVVNKIDNSCFGGVYSSTTETKGNSNNLVKFIVRMLEEDKFIEYRIGKGRKGGGAGRGRVFI